jgi:hypothetical protein
LNDIPAQIIERFFHAMLGGSTAEEEMRVLFAEDATYVEPFSGAPRMHEGREAILATLRQGWQTPLPKMRIEIERVDLEGGKLRALWTCHSPALPGGYGRGENLFSLNKQGQIQRLETRLGTASEGAGTPSPLSESS